MVVWFRNCQLCSRKLNNESKYDQAGLCGVCTDKPVASWSCEYREFRKMASAQAYRNYVRGMRS